MKNRIYIITLLLFLLPLSGSAEIKGRYKAATGPRARPIPAERSVDQVHIIEIFAFTCPHCMVFHRQTKPKLKKRFGNKLKIDAYPIGWVGPNPAKLYYIAQSNGKGDEMKDFIFSAIIESGIRDINSKQVLGFIAEQYDLEKEFKADIDSKKIDAIFKKGKKYAKDFKINSTPTLVLENAIIPERDIENLSRIINSFLKEPVQY